MRLTTFQQNNKIYIEFPLKNGIAFCDVYEKTEAGKIALLKKYNEISQLSNAMIDIKSFFLDTVNEIEKEVENGNTK